MKQHVDMQVAIFMFSRKSIYLLLAIVAVVLFGSIYLGPKNQDAVTYHIPLSVAGYPGLLEPVLNLFRQ